MDATLPPPFDAGIVMSTILSVVGTQRTVGAVLRVRSVIRLAMWTIAVSELPNYYSSALRLLNLLSLLSPA